MLVSNNPSERSKELLIILSAVPLGLLVISYLVLMRHYTVPSSSMMPSLHIGDFIFADRFRTSWHGSIVRGDIVVFKFGSVDYLKRVIGMPGETIQFRKGRVFIDGQPVVLELLNERMDVSGNEARVQIETLSNGRSYRILDVTTTLGDETTEYFVPEGHYFVVGDNRDNSNDSRFGVGMVSAQAITGKARAVVFNADGKTRFGLAL